MSLALEYEIRTSDGDYLRQYVWDGENHLLAVKLWTAGVASTATASDTTVAMGYDDQGGRVGRKQTAGATVEADNRYLTDYGNPTGYSQVLEQLDSSATSAEKDFIYGADLLAQADSGDGPAYLLGDHLGSTRLLTDGAGGAITNTAFDYSPYGDPIGTSASSLTDYPHAFTGQWRDDTLGMQFHRARWLNILRGRWISIDPRFDWPQNYAGPYSYASLDAINHLDPNGTLSSLAEVAVVAAICSVIGGAIGATLGGVRGFVIGLAVGALIGAAYSAAVLGIIGKVTTAAISALALFVVKYFGLRGPNPSIPIPPSVGYITATPSKFNGRYAFVSLENSSVHAGGEFWNDQFGSRKSAQIAQMLYDNGYSVTYGRPENRSMLFSGLRMHSYSYIYTLSHGGIDMNGISNMEIRPQTLFGADGGEYASAREIADNIRGTPKFVFLDGCDMQGGNELINANARIFSSGPVNGVPADAQLLFLAKLFDINNGDIASTYRDVYGSTPVYHLAGNGNMNR